MATSLLLHWHQNTPLCDPQSQKPQRASNQSDKTELSQSVCIQPQNRLPVCPSACLSVRPSVWLTVCLCLPRCPFHVSVFLFSFFFYLLSVLPFLSPYFLTSFHLPILLSFTPCCSIFPFYSSPPLLPFLYFFLTSFLFGVLFPPVLPFVCPSSPPSFLSPCNGSSHLPFQLCFP